MYKLIQMQLPTLAARLRSLAYCDGQPLTANWIATAFLNKEANQDGALT